MVQKAGNKNLKKVSPKEVDRVFQLQKENRWKIATSSANDRIKKIKLLKATVEKYEEDLKEAMRLDFRKSPHEVLITEIMPVINEANDAIHNLKNWMKPVDVPTPLFLFPSQSQIIYEAKGVVLIIGPWNYPFHLIMAPLVASIASGNCAMIKPSNNTPNTSNLVRKMLDEIFPENEIKVMAADRDTANELLEKPFDHIFFTGSPSVGVTIMEAAAKNLTSVTLELGGKSPAIIDKNTDLDSIISRVLWGKILNGGQTCVGIDYALVHESKYSEFIEKIKKQILVFYGEDNNSWQTTPDFCRIVNDKNYTRLKETLEAALKKGAKIEQGGNFDPKERYISPTIVSNVDTNSPLMKEELFGPILPVLKFSDLDEAIKVVQSKEKPLALYLFSESEDTIQKVLANTSSGGAVINGCIAHLGNSNLPFGGVNHSGLGNYHGHFGFKAFSHERSVLRLSKFTPVKLLFPPYTNFTKRFSKLIMNYLS